MTWTIWFWWGLFGLAWAWLTLFLHEGSHAAAILLSGHEVTIWKPYPHVWRDSFGRRYFYWGRASSGTQDLGPFWEVAHKFAPLVVVGGVMVGAGGGLLAGGPPEHPAAQAALGWALGWPAIDRFWLFLLGALGRGDHREASVRLGWSRATEAVVGVLGMMLVTAWVSGVAFRVMF